MLLAPEIRVQFRDVLTLLQVDGFRIASMVQIAKTFFKLERGGRPFANDHYGFNVVRPEELSLSRQIRCFNDAEAVVSPHGGSLANLAFCRKQCKVIELFPAANIDLYYRISRALGLDYSYVKATNGDADPPWKHSHETSPTESEMGGTQRWLQIPNHLIFLELFKHSHTTFSFFFIRSS